MADTTMTELSRWAGRQLVAWSMFAGLLAICSTMLLAPDIATAQGGIRTDIEIDHGATGFPLTGGHAQVQCQRCHLQGIFRGTPTQCMQCHSPGGRVVSTSKPSNHLPTTLNCNSCHRTTNWKPAFFTHNGVAPGTCARCHNNSTVQGKPATHIPTTMSCDSCHRTVAWMGASFRHIGVVPGTCAICHNGVQARGKPTGHMSTSASCDSCHRMGAANWVLVSTGYNHSGVVPGTCANCHGKNATGIPVSHKGGTNPVISCDSCHQTSGWRPATMNHTAVAATPCGTCHNNTLARGIPAGHKGGMAPGACNTCHSTTAWIPATMNHVGVMPGTCATCHGKTATGIPVSHKGGTNAAAACDSCHRTTGWRPATMNHTAVAATPCGTCHNNTLARGIPAGHKGGMAPGACNTCHSTTAWIPATFNHTGVTPGTCNTCHGVTSSGIPANHKGGTNPAISCDSCHRTTGWRPATMNHTAVAATPCANCHNGSLATGKSGAHFVTTQACNKCHGNTTAWSPVTTYAHTTPYYKAHRSGVPCSSCHTNNNEVIAWQFAAYKPDCAGCHAGTFKPGPHKKVDSPTILYTVAELKDCSGSCHTYTDTTFTKIKTSRTGQHRPTGSF